MEVINRDELERKLSRIVGRDLRAELSKLMDLLGDPPALANVPNEYWQNGWRDSSEGCRADLGGYVPAAS